MDDTPVDFESVLENAEKDGISLEEIIIQYKGLTPLEINDLKQCGLVINESSEIVHSRFPLSGLPLFSHKAIAVFTLSA